jgi:formate dehydrogenase major subunit
VPGLGTSFGRGGATTAQQDLSNADAILIMGSNMAENHPVGFQWVMEAREKNGAKVIHIDPRFTRTSSMADIWAPLRAGSDVLFLGALINYVLAEGKDFRDYVVAYTNAATILREDFRDTEDLGGLFSGWDPQKKKYDPTSWLYQGSPKKDGDAGHHEHGGGHGKDRGGEAGDIGKYESDPTLQHPRCVYQVLKKHFSRYTPEMVEQSCGVPKELFFKVAEAYCSASGPGPSAMRWDGRSIPTACKSFAQLRSCSCFWVTLEGRAAAFLPCVAMPPFKVPPTWRRCMTFCPAIFPLPC